ncbi:MAG: lytic murein transglycosylase [Robiginitomaculum sp.]|nr:MAG: lytic murein transglycosylase [Robiginitomaculum sp.]
MRRLKIILLCGVVGTFAACATTAPVVNGPSQAEQDLKNAPIAKPIPDEQAKPILKPISKPGPNPVLDPNFPSIVLPAPTSPVSVPEPLTKPVPIPQQPIEYRALPLWGQADHIPALNAFRRTCGVWATRDDNTDLDKTRFIYGQYKDWREACDSLSTLNISQRFGASYAKQFFEAHFLPLKPLPSDGNREGLLTGYYAPEIDARLHANAEFSEPILARPKNKSKQNLSRSDINVHTSKVLAYGRPIDVFFLQIQGSGRIVFPDGTKYVCAFDGHNGHEYKSIGRVLINRGELTKAQASKASIENWMKRAGLDETRALMNENPRYVFFKTEHVRGKLGPKGAFGVPLTAMGSLAIDPRARPYGSLVWLEAKIPQSAGDFIGKQTGLLVVAQDTGGAIKGYRRGDIYFGAGKEAGDKAGVMKHKGVWTILLPTKLARRVQKERAQARGPS